MRGCFACRELIGNFAFRFFIGKNNPRLLIEVLELTLFSGPVEHRNGHTKEKIASSSKGSSER